MVRCASDRTHVCVSRRLPGCCNSLARKHAYSTRPIYLCRIKSPAMIHPAVHELRDHSMWSEGQVWCSPERHGQITGIIKAQIDHLPLAYAGMRPTQGRTLAVMQVSAGSQSFNSVNTLRVLGRWMRMFAIPNQSSVAKAFDEFDDTGRMKPSSYYDRIVDVMEELVRFTVLLRPHSAVLVDRYSERKAAGKRVTAADQLAAKANSG